MVPDHLDPLQIGSHPGLPKLYQVGLEATGDLDRMRGDSRGQVTQHVLEIPPRLFSLEEERQAQSIKLGIAAAAFGVNKDSKVRALLFLFISVKALLDTTGMGNGSGLKTASPVGVSPVSNV